MKWPRPIARCLPGGTGLHLRRQTAPAAVAIIRGTNIDQLPIPRTVRDRQLEELEALGLVEPEAGWRLTKRAEVLLGATGLR